MGTGVEAKDLQARTKKFGLRIITVCQAVPASSASSVIARQLLRSGTSVGANYQAACRARSKPDFISKVGIAIEEADESLYWMEMLVEARIVSEERLAPLMKEAEEIIAILTASAKTAKARQRARGT